MAAVLSNSTQLCYKYIPDSTYLEKMPWNYYFDCKVNKEQLMDRQPYVFAEFQKTKGSSLLS